MHSSAVRASHPATRIYTRPNLLLYDMLVMGVLADRVWGCPAHNFVDHYRRHLTPNHAEIGAGTGYCLDRCGFPSPNPRVVLIDLQANCLAHSARRLARYRPRTYLHDARQPLNVGIERFDSIALCGLLHCLSGTMWEKAAVFDALEPIAAPGATIFGYSLVSDDVQQRAPARYVHRCLNRLRIINNANDHLSDLHAELARRFVAPRIEPIGCLAFFSARVSIAKTKLQDETFHE